MIPKVIHYCWFGGKPHPKSVRKCIASWRKFLPDYEIKEWNESNFNVDSIPYTRDAYRNRKYAFVSDYARFYILYHYGGLYFDTDVEVIRPFDELVSKGAFMGIEQDGTHISINPGLALGSEPHSVLYKELLDLYQRTPFYHEDAVGQNGLVVPYTTEQMIRHGFQPKNEIQVIEGITIYPNDYFNPLEDATGRLNITSNTYSIHWYTKTWANHYGPVRIWITRRAHRYLGVNCFSRIKRFFQK